MLTEDAVRAAMAELETDIEVAEVGAEEDLFDAGFDSLDLADLLLSLQESHGLEVPDEDLELCRSIRAIVAYAGRAEAS
ncbi:MAG: phosphopantetheine-binding protein [Myxococcota bacterium]|nr:phosphopantetheine-binding protein [Myxococcota bacterium]